MDADLGLGNIDVLLGLAPKFNLSHVVMGAKSVSDIIVEGPGHLMILPASSGIQELTQLSQDQNLQLLAKLEPLNELIDIILIDTAAGISSSVMHFNAAAHEIIVVVTPEPTSITDAYALMKLLSIKYSEKRFKLLVNLAKNIHDASEVYRQLNLVAEKFLDISIEYLGCILFDENVFHGVKLQKVVAELFPDTQASKCFTSLAKKICLTRAPSSPKGRMQFLWRRFLDKGSE